MITSLIQLRRAPARILTGSEFREHYRESSHLVRVKKPVCVDAFCFHSWREDEQLSVSCLSEKEIPEASVLVVPSGRYSGPKGRRSGSLRATGMLRLDGHGWFIFNRIVGGFSVTLHHSCYRSLVFVEMWVHSTSLHVWYCEIRQNLYASSSAFVRWPKKKRVFGCFFQPQACNKTWVVPQ